jgi:signal transduction histidine kinase/ActR/RegA family two-component response regulator
MIAPGMLIERFGRRMAVTPWLALAAAVTLLIASFALALHNERSSRDEKLRDVTVQAQILAGSLAGPLAFDDDAATQEYIDALKANPDILAVGAYDERGGRTAGFARRGEAPPETNAVAASQIDDAGELIVTAPVAQNGTQLGSVYLRAALEPWMRRMMRYLGIGIVVVMASLLVAVLGASYASVAEAHRRLKQESEERRRMEEVLRQSQKMEAMGQLTGGVAHDFNNLLMVAASGMELLDRTDDPNRRERLKEAIRQAIDRGAKLTQQLLTFARRSPLRPEVIALGSRILGLRDLLDRSLREDIAIEIDLPSDLWPVEVDTSQLEVALLNIAVNARDAMPHGGMIRIEGANQPAPAGDIDMVRLAIVDEGIGMAAELRDKVFEPFFTTKGAGHGTGLGLSQVYGFARSAGGSVRIDSEVGQGTTITLLLPRSHAIPPREDEVAPFQATGVRRSCHVLVAEDDDTVAELVTQMLDVLGYQSSRVADATMALAVIEAGEASIDVILSDMVMPGEMSGLDLAHAVKQLDSTLPIVLMTGYSDAAASAAAEGIDLLVKPYTLEALGNTLQTAMIAPASAA